jgi:hypothetical protein
MKRLCHILAALAFIAATSAIAHESPGDHVRREASLTLEGNRLVLTYRIEPGERNVLVELHAMDADADGNISDVERDAFFAERARDLAALLELSIAGARVPLVPEGAAALDAGFGQTYRFTAMLDAQPRQRLAAELNDVFSAQQPGPFHYRAPGAATRIALLGAAPAESESAHPERVALHFTIDLSQP